MKWYDWLVILVLVVLAFVPDPSDILDLGFPFLEGGVALTYYFVRKTFGGKKHGKPR